MYCRSCTSYEAGFVLSTFFAGFIKYKCFAFKNNFIWKNMWMKMLIKNRCGKCFPISQYFLENSYLNKAKQPILSSTLSTCICCACDCLQVVYFFPPRLFRQISFFGIHNNRLFPGKSLIHQNRGRSFSSISEKKILTSRDKGTLCLCTIKPGPHEPVLFDQFS